MTPDRSGLWYYRDTVGVTHDRVARVQFFRFGGGKADRPDPGGYTRVGLMTGDVQSSLDLGPDREWLGPVPPFRPWTAVEDGYPEPGVPVEIRYVAAYGCEWRDGDVARAIAFQDTTFREHGIDVPPDRQWADDRSGDSLHADAYRVTHWRHLDDGPADHPGRT